MTNNWIKGYTMFRTHVLIENHPTTGHIDIMILKTSIDTYIYTVSYNIPVVPHKAVAEVSKIGNQ